MELQDSKEPSPVKKEHSPKPVELLKDLQTTVHQAKTKIGDLQVPIHEIDVPRNNVSSARSICLFSLLLYGSAIELIWKKF